MRLYEGTIDRFRKDVIQNQIADIISNNYFIHYGRSVAPSEKNSWNNSLNFVKNALDFSQLNDNKVVVEYELPYSSRRIDVLLFGRNGRKRDSIVLIELKQWSNDNIKDCETEGNVIVDYGRFKKEQAHPSLQVEGYHYDLKDFMTIFAEKLSPKLSSCAYCHNYSKVKDEVLYLSKFSKYIEKYPLFSKEEIENLGTYLKERLHKGAGLEVFNRFITSPIKPSKRLLDHTKNMINKQQIFNLIDDQITAYNSIMHKAKKLAKTNKKSVIVVKGGPGTGKSVIALEVMGELLRKGKNVYHATGSSAFTKTLRKILGTRSSKLFKFFNSFMAYKENQIEVLICDEAHRIRETSSNRYTPRHLRTDTPQIDELVKAAKLSIFFIDEHQVVRPNEIGSISLIKKAAKKLKIDDSEICEFELKTQFRCSGSDAFLQWIENALKIRESGKQFLSKEDRMDFKIFDDPIKLKKAIDEKNEKKKNCARIVAGFCWPWSKPNPDGSLVNDVKVDGLEMPWEKKDQFWKWATDDSGMDQVGTVYTAQGFEFDYIGIIFGNDLVYDPRKNVWVANPENSYDTMAKRGNANFTKHLKNVYRVLMSRAHKGCFVYFIDKSTEDFFKSKIRTKNLLIEAEEHISLSEPTSSIADTLDELLSDIPKEKQYKDYLPVYSLKAAAGKFGEGMDVENEGWLKVNIEKKLNRRMFIAKVVGQSMEPRIPDGSFCIFQRGVEGTRQNKIVLVQHNDISDPDTGGKYTVKKYTSKKRATEEGSWEHEEINLLPLNPNYDPISIPNSEEGGFMVIAEFISVLSN